MKAIHCKIVFQQVGVCLLNCEKLMEKALFIFFIKINQKLKYYLGLGWFINLPFGTGYLAEIIRHWVLAQSAVTLLLTYCNCKYNCQIKNSLFKDSI